MRIVFWQNCLSPHQLPYIVRIIEDERVDSVVIAAGEAVSKSRKDMGWDILSTPPGLDRCEVYLDPNPQTIEHLLSIRQEDSYHLFSGIRGFEFVFKALSYSLKYKLKRGIVTERPNTFAFGCANGKPLWMHRIRFFLQDRKFAPYIQSVFAMGDDAADYFRSVWKEWTVYPFAYCVNEETESMCCKHHLSDENIRFAFVGSLSYWKAVKHILKADQILLKTSMGGGKISIIGNGPQLPMLESYKHSHHLENTHFFGTKKNSEIPLVLREHDVLILPSIYDGWGAVVNEALTLGLYVICSDKCGAKELLTDRRCGSVFRGGDYKQLAEIMRQSTETLSEIRANRTFRREWAKQCISGKAISKYMIDCLENKKAERPWLDKLENV